MFEPEPPLPRLPDPGPDRLLTNLPYLCRAGHCFVQATEQDGWGIYRHLSPAGQTRLTVWLPDYPDGLGDLLYVWVSELHRRAGQG